MNSTFPPGAFGVPTDTLRPPAPTSAKAPAGGNSWEQQIDDADLLATLNTLIEVNRVGEFVFRICAGRAQSDSLHALFDRRATEYRQATTELQMIALRRGLQPEPGDKMIAALRSVWSLASARWSGLNDGTLLAECEAGEGVTRRRLHDAMDQVLPADVRAAVCRHIEDVARSLDSLHEHRSQPVTDAMPSPGV